MSYPTFGELVAEFIDGFDDEREGGEFREFYPPGVQEIRKQARRKGMEFAKWAEEQTTVPDVYDDTSLEVWISEVNDRSTRLGYGDWFENKRADAEASRTFKVSPFPAIPAQQPIGYAVAAEPIKEGQPVYMTTPSARKTDLELAQSRNPVTAAAARARLALFQFDDNPVPPTIHHWHDEKCAALRGPGRDHLCNCNGGDFVWGRRGVRARGDLDI